MELNLCFIQVNWSIWAHNGSIRNGSSEYISMCEKVIISGDLKVG